ncbi:MAG TPA: M28 family peptidase, partial [Steroidobacteraceae bacterium]|nr:M28 family peptidase [Steroidobacteraceae bacterium]
MLVSARAAVSLTTYLGICALTCAARAESPVGAVEILGFSIGGAAAEAQLEQRFDADLSAADLRSWMEQMSSEPNHVGSVHDKVNAEFQLKKFREWGWDASIETCSVLYPSPREVSLELVAPTHFAARLTEPPVAGDGTSSKTKDELPAYNVYGADGDVTAELVYVNQGMPDDYQELERQGVSVKGRIVLTRYGGGWRGLKPKLAYEHGAAGCLIYSDPRDDGYGAGDTYPKGGYRPSDGVQRGSVQDLVLYAGDPLTPGVGATADAKRLAIKDAKTILKIPVLPISYAAAEPLLAALGGRVAPAAWRGGLPLTYHVGPGPAKVHLKVLSDWNQKTLYDVVAKIRGAQEPDRWIVRGNHHDAWVFGATDPLAGQVALMAEAKAIGKLVKDGWRPRRTLVYASWDGEEPGLLGSTEWAELHAADLKSKAALYVNSDTNGRGYLGVSGSH